MDDYQFRNVLYQLDVKTIPVIALVEHIAISYDKTDVPLTSGGLKQCGIYLSRRLHRLFLIHASWQSQTNGLPLRVSDNSLNTVSLIHKRRLLCR